MDFLRFLVANYDVIFTSADAFPAETTMRAVGGAILHRISKGASSKCSFNSFALSKTLFAQQESNQLPSASSISS